MAKISLIMFAILFNVSLFAQNVGMDEAKKIAENYMLMKKSNTLENALTVSEYYTKYNESGDVLYYIFNFENGGFVIVSGDKRLTPILAHSTTNTFLLNEKNHPANVFLEGYETGINYVRTTKNEMAISSKWNEIATGKQHKAVVKEVGPLLTSVWNQDKYYNALCPDDGTKTAGTPLYDYHVPNGCVALAMAQIMYFHRYPRQGVGSSSYTSNYGRLSANYGETIYDYEAMTDKATGYSDALARLIFHAGVSVKMNYAADGSGAQSMDAYTAFMQRFNYKTSMKYITGGDNPENSKSWWKDTIRQSIDKGLPVYYAACRTTGSETDPDACHAFVCDGYIIDDAANDEFHFNFGWGGSNNGFYTLSTMQGYTLRNNIIIDIEPKTDDNFFTGQDTLTATYGSFNDGSGRLNYKNNTNCSWLISPQDGKNISSITLTAASFSLADGDTVKIYEGNIASALTAILTGDSLQNKSYTVNASQALVVFTSDASIDGEGFTFNYTSSKTSSNYCSTSQTPTSITTANGSIDNASGTAVYDSDNTCYWAISPAGMNNQVNFAFEKFDLAQGDIIEVYAYPATNQVTSGIWNKYWEIGVARFSTDNIPALDSIYRVSAPTVLFRFRTDNKLNATGFKIFWNEDMSIDNNIGLSGLSIYPNPASDVINVNLTTDTEENVRIDVYDMVGKNLYSIPTLRITGQHEENINVSNYAKGLYLLRVSTSIGVVTKKIAIE